MQAMQNGSAATHELQQHAEQEDSAAFWRAWLSANLKGSQLDEPQRPLEPNPAAVDVATTLTSHSRCALLLHDTAAAVDDWVTYAVLATAHCWQHCPPSYSSRRSSKHPAFNVLQYSWLCKISTSSANDHMLASWHVHSKCRQQSMQSM
jgi:hypothetical protein